MGILKCPRKYCSGRLYSTEPDDKGLIITECTMCDFIATFKPIFIVKQEEINNALDDEVL